MDMMQPQAQPPLPDGQAKTGYTVCIQCSPDGSFAVGLEGAEMKPAATVKDALTIALGIIKAGGGEQKEDFMAGYEQPVGR